ncbi:MAG: hypothetical protein ACI4V2_03415 [Alloprevotella sp.]
MTPIIYKVCRRHPHRLLRLWAMLMPAVLTLPVATAQVVVEAKLDRPEMLIGEQATLTQKVTARRGAHVKLADYKEGDTVTAGVEVVTQSAIDTTLSSDGKRFTLKRDYLITSFDSAIYALGPISAEVDGKTYVSHGRMGLKVNTVPVDTVHLDRFEAPFTVVGSPFVWQDNLLLRSLGVWLLGLGLIVALVVLSDKRKKYKRVVIPPPVPPYKKGHAALEQLRQDPAADDMDDERRPFYDKLTAILREYLKDRFAFDAPQMTTAEVLATMAYETDAVGMDRLKDILTSSDRVKFSAATDTPFERRHLIDETERLMAATRDEAMETRREPEVRIVPYGQVAERRRRVIWMVIAVVLSLSLLLVWAWSAYGLYDLGMI